MAIALPAFIALRLSGSIIIFATPAPSVIPSLREWQGSSGSFTMSSASRIIVDPSYALQLKETALVFQNDLLEVTGDTLPVITSISSRPGDFFLSLRNSDPVIGNEGYLFKLVDSLVIASQTSQSAFLPPLPPFPTFPPVPLATNIAA